MPQSSRSRWRTATPASARLFSTTIPRPDDTKHDKIPSPEQGRHEDEQHRRPTEEEPLFTKVRASGDDWALLHGSRATKVLSKHVRLSLEGLKPFGIERAEHFRNLVDVDTLSIQEARKRRDRSNKARDQFIRPPPKDTQLAEEPRTASGGDNGLPQDSLGHSGKSPTAKRQRRWPIRVSRDVENVDGRHPLMWKSIMHREESDKIVKRRQPSPGPQALKGPARRSRPNKIHITIDPQPKGVRLNAQETGNLKKAMARDSGYESWTVTPPKVRQAINRQVRLTAAGLPSPFFVRAPNPVGQSNPFTPLPLKPQPAGVDVGEFAGAAAAMGPAESVSKLLAEDPILKEAASLSKIRKGPTFSQPSSKPDMHIEPRFRVLPTWQWLERQHAKGLESTSGQSEPEPLEGSGQASRTNIETEVQQEQSQEGHFEHSKPRPGAPKLTVHQDMKAEILPSGPASSKEVLPAAGDNIKSMKSAQPQLSIFEQLFSEERPRGNNYWRIADRLRSVFSAVEKNPDADARLEREASGRVPQAGQSIFGQLFPEQSESRPEESEEGVRKTTSEPLVPPKDSLMISLRNEVRNWIPEDQQGRATYPQPREYGSHSTVIVISGTSPSLIDTDFYRIAPEGKHVEGWAGGLVKVVQARDSITYEPLGQYYLMFHSRPSALAYADEVTRLHDLSRKLLHAPAASGKQVAKGALDHAPAAPQPFLTDAEQAAVRSFTLVSPNLPLNISVRPWNTRLVADIAAKSNIADVVQTLKPEAVTPAKVLLKVNPSEGGSRSGDDPGGLTTDELWLTLRDDGRERSAPWVLANLSQGIMPVKPVFTSAHSGIKVRSRPVPVSPGPEDELYDDEGEGGGEPVAGQLPSAVERSEERLGGGADRHERFSRFILTFTQQAIARRFVRCWHKRAIYDAVLGRSVVVDAIALM